MVLQVELSKTKMELARIKKELADAVKDNANLRSHVQELKSKSRLQAQATSSVAKEPKKRPAQEQDTFELDSGEDEQPPAKRMAPAGPTNTVGTSKSSQALSGTVHVPQVSAVESAARMQEEVAKQVRDALAKSLPEALAPLLASSRATASSEHRGRDRDWARPKSSFDPPEVSSGEEEFREYAQAQSPRRQRREPSNRGSTLQTQAQPQFQPQNQFQQPQTQFQPQPQAQSMAQAQP